MKKILTILFLILISCKSEKKTSADLESFIADKVWFVGNKKTGTQYYFSDKEKRQYLWMTFERRDDGTYTPFVIAKGTPETNPLPNVLSTYREGWSPTDFYKVVGDSLVLQDEEDINGEDIWKFKLEVIKDTTIGIFEYERIRLTNYFGAQIWKTKK